MWHFKINFQNYPVLHIHPIFHEFEFVQNFSTQKANTTELCYDALK